METITVTPTDTTNVARFVLTQQLDAIKAEQRAQWPLEVRRLEKSLDDFLNPGSRLPGEYIIDQIERALCRLMAHTNWAVQQLEDKAQQQLIANLRKKKGG